MIKYIKESKPELEKNEDDRKVRNSVEEILTTIKKDGDKAIRLYSEKFDNYSPAVFKLSDKEICKNTIKFNERSRGGNTSWGYSWS